MFQVYGNVEDDKFEQYLDMPHYIIICDTRSAPSPMEEIQYSGQDFIQKVSPVPPTSSDGAEIIESGYMDQFFTGFSQAEWRYKMKPWLRKMYPRDAWMTWLPSSRTDGNTIKRKRQLDLW